MLKTRVIPCMLFNGFCLVKTIQFGQERTLGNPIQFARVYNSRNVDELIFIDMSASQECREPVFDLIAGIFKECFMPLAVGGGIHTMATVDRLMKIGADKVIINSAALANPNLIKALAEKYGSQSIVVGIDAKKDVEGKYWVYTNRGRTRTPWLVEDWAQQVVRQQAGEIFLNSIDCDGTMAGYDIPLIRRVVDAVSIPVIACGGAGKADHILEAVMVGRADAVALASLFHYTEYTPNEIKGVLAQASVAVRWNNKF